MSCPELAPTVSVARHCAHQLPPNASLYTHALALCQVLRALRVVVGSSTAGKAGDVTALPRTAHGLGLHGGGSQAPAAAAAVSTAAATADSLGDTALARFAKRFDLSDDGRHCAAAMVLFFERAASAATRAKAAAQTVASRDGVSQTTVLARLLAARHADLVSHAKA